MQTTLSEEVEVSVKFSEVDALGIVWHGHYIRYFEDGREAFGKKYGIGYMDVFEKGFTTPLIHIDCKYKRSLKYGDKAIVHTKYCPLNVPKIRFEYTMLHPETKEIICTGTSEQVFLDTEKGLLQLTDPLFYEEWKQKWKI
jgi:acyl-CoA thioester hydrolase